MFSSIAELVGMAQDRGLSISDIAIDEEMRRYHETREEVWAKMSKNLQTMKSAVDRGSQGKGVFSKTGLTGGEAALLEHYRKTRTSLSGDAMLEAVVAAMATNEVNAAMGIICATPTAGSSGTLPGVITVLKNRLGLDDDKLIRCLFTAGAFGLVTANQAMIAGATGGCQAEVGSASGMAAAAAVEGAGGDSSTCAQAFAIALSNLLGLVCDPVAGLVEIPCVKRNAIGTANALVAADIALSGGVSRIPADEVIGAMKSIGESMPSSLRETGIGGLAGTPTGKRFRRTVFDK
ncbi:L-serine ammonia-lyase, iron-sulfur-dependent, subunit alpha [Bifidobacterium sp. B4001]|nr:MULTISPECIES: L-serine ammonia-lyase, iron-sulfur-dependent, subunit alpha [unclassified Bifidobacterium]MCX8673187.1 L-serine ammonia-lyase, iron-sulfur-dependent, subunit alpha [Bifidobacterium sp. B4079]MCX8681620.1 L-serine ammonia-lyase, iron-sulfur-dependent, subunit alpha [Bifidobacterium sp. B4001]MCX8686855.1 L-serine ammonia-lyase, iron-sulfur-dependent, subunit alpha [Bifidobacterium sp. B4142]QYN61356.1 L-serine ammonia-lyase, iron-sulfur-dependent, subunit alpha [Bifidobacterium